MSIDLPEYCPDCGNSMIEEEAISDYQDPGNPYGHRQETELIKYCPDCGYNEEMEVN